LEEHVTTPMPQHARTGAVVRGWRTFRRWRRSRPFWGGLFTALAGLEIFATTQLSLGGLSFQMGPTGFLTWLIPTILVACGMLLWFSPQQRMFYAIVAAVTAVFSLIGVNLGGFLIGLLLGMVGSALGFAWVPVAPPAAEPEAEPEPDTDADADGGEADQTAEQTTVDRLLDGPADAETTGELPPAPKGHSPRLMAITLIMLGVSAVGLVTLRGGEPAQAAPCPPATKPPATAKPTPTQSTSPSPTPTTASDAPEKDDGGNLVTDILDGIGDLFGIGESDSEKPAAAPAPEASEAPAPRVSPTPAPSQSTGPVPKPAPDKCETSPGTGNGGENGGGAKPTIRRVAAPSGIDPVGPLSKMTGTKQTNLFLTYVGVTALPVRTGGTMDVLWFTMTRSTTDNFELRPVIPGDKTMSLKSSALTVEGHVRFFTPRFTGKLLGIPQVYTPTTPPPLIPGLPTPIPIVFTDIDIQLAYVDCDKLGAPDLLNTLPG
jgi:hypothetical protein